MQLGFYDKKFTILQHGRRLQEGHKGEPDSLTTIYFHYADRNNDAYGSC